MGLRNGDLKYMVYDIVGIDEYSSKMGENQNIVTISFQVKTSEPAEDLCNFLENGYDYILDADVSPGETEDGDYLVFVELKREKGVHENILQILKDVGKLCSIDKFKFRYYKQFRSNEVSIETIEELVPDDPDNYGIVQDRTKNDDYSSFFSNSFAESVHMRGNNLIVKRKFADDLIFEFIDFGDSETVAPTLTESYDILNSYPEILFLTKKIGDYNISKYGDKLVFEKKTDLLVLRRIQ